MSCISLTDLAGDHARARTILCSTLRECTMSTCKDSTRAQRSSWLWASFQRGPSLPILMKRRASSTWERLITLAVSCTLRCSGANHLKKEIHRVGKMSTISQNAEKKTKTNSIFPCQAAPQVKRARCDHYLNCKDRLAQYHSQRVQCRLRMNSAIHQLKWNI